jgi:hypothetical protein
MENIYNKDITIVWSMPSTKKAAIGDKSNPPIGGSIFLKGARIGSVTS